MKTDDKEKNYSIVSYYNKLENKFLLIERFIRFLAKCSIVSGIVTPLITTLIKLRMIMYPYFHYQTYFYPQNFPPYLFFVLTSTIIMDYCYHFVQTIKAADPNWIKISGAKKVLSIITSIIKLPMTFLTIFFLLIRYKDEIFKNIIFNLESAFCFTPLISMSASFLFCASIINLLEFLIFGCCILIKFPPGLVLFFHYCLEKGEPQLSNVPRELKQISDIAGKAFPIMIIDHGGENIRRKLVNLKSSSSKFMEKLLFRMIIKQDLMLFRKTFKAIIDFREFRNLLNDRFFTETNTYYQLEINVKKAALLEILIFNKIPNYSKFLKSCFKNLPNENQILSMIKQLSSKDIRDFRQLVVTKILDKKKDNKFVNTPKSAIPASHIENLFSKFFFGKLYKILYENFEMLAWDSKMLEDLGICKKLNSEALFPYEILMKIFSFTLDNEQIKECNISHNSNALSEVEQFEEYNIPATSDTLNLKNFKVILQI